MVLVLTVLNLIVLIATSLFLFLLVVTCFQENEHRAAWISLGGFFINGLIWAGFLWAPTGAHALNGIFLIGFALFTLASIVRFFPNPSPPRVLSSIEQYDERDTMFARNNIQHYPDIMEQYYHMRPENKSGDLQIHSKPEFGDPAQTFHDHYTAPFTNAAFEYLEGTIPLSNGKTADHKLQIDPVQFCQALFDFGKFYGACDVSFVKLKPHHFYSHKGRHAKSWGEKSDQNYQTGIVIVVPMRVAMLKQGPTSCVLQESAQKYVEAAKISNIMAGYIRSFGYRARAHNDANYDTLCVPAAVESGIGELGRMGLLMHRTHGPCVRLAIVTTELDLPANPAPSPKPISMEEFCKICKKCADNCPSGSISHEAESVTRNVRHWTIKQEQCFSYWKTIGSDCGLCISVCPYTKPDTVIHQFVRWYISRNTLNQHIALFMDDLLYGRKKPLPESNPDSIFMA